MAACRCLNGLLIKSNITTLLNSFIAACKGFTFYWHCPEVSFLHPVFCNQQTIYSNLFLHHQRVLQFDYCHHWRCSSVYLPPLCFHWDITSQVQGKKTPHSEKLVHFMTSLSTGGWLLWWMLFYLELFPWLPACVPWPPHSSDTHRTASCTCWTATSASSRSRSGFKTARISLTWSSPVKRECTTKCWRVRIVIHVYYRNLGGNWGTLAKILRLLLFTGHSTESCHGFKSKFLL